MAARLNLCRGSQAKHWLGWITACSLIAARCAAAADFSVLQSFGDAPFESAGSIRGSLDPAVAFPLVHDLRARSPHPTIATMHHAYHPKRIASCRHAQGTLTLHREEWIECSRKLPATGGRRRLLPPAPAVAPDKPDAPPVTASLRARCHRQGRLSGEARPTAQRKRVQRSQGCCKRITERVTCADHLISSNGSSAHDNAQERLTLHARRGAAGTDGVFALEYSVPSGACPAGLPATAQARALSLLPTEAHRCAGTSRSFSPKLATPGCKR